MWRFLFSKDSVSQKCSLYQLRNLIGRFNVTNPKSRFDECEDFLILVVEAYILACALELFQMDSVDDKPTFVGVEDDVWLKSAKVRRTILMEMSRAVVDKFVQFRFHDLPTNVSDDNVKSHSILLVSMGLFYLNFRDAIKEGDGRRVLTMWKYMLPIFISTGRKNYAKETLLMLFKHTFLFSPRLSRQLMYSRFVNTHGVIGKNIACDLHNEHLNRLCKDVIHGLRANKKVECITKASQALGNLDAVLTNFDEHWECAKASGRHSKSTQQKDRESIVKELQKMKAVQYVENRPFIGIPRPASLLHKFSKERLGSWINEHIENNFTV